MPDPVWQTGEVHYLGRYSSLSDLLDEVQRILRALREYWPALEVRFLLDGSATRARHLARLHCVELPT
jgi:hypothetical protein